MKAYALFLVLFSLNAFASESRWRLCEGTVSVDGSPTALFVNVYETRVESTVWTTDLALILGPTILTGSFDTDDGADREGPQAVHLAGDGTKFSGEVQFVGDASVLAISGTLAIDEESQPVQSTLSCRSIAD